MTSTTNPLRAVFSLPPADLDRAEFETWYPGHIRDILGLPGVLSARLYRTKAGVGKGSPTAYDYVAFYEVESEGAAETLAGIDTALGTDRVPLPEFFGRSRWAVYDLAAIDEIRPAHTLDAESLYLVFSAPPAGRTTTEYEDWYHRHVRENVEIGQLAAAHRWNVAATLVDPELPPHATHLASYELTAGPAEMNRLLDGAIAEGRIVLPDWFPGIDFASTTATAVTDRIASA
ncbi:hypothetical protein [Microbacterium tumbae]